MSVNESTVEDAALEWFSDLVYEVRHGPTIAPGGPGPERETFGDVVLVGRLRDAIQKFNRSIPEEAREEALRKVLRVGTPSLTQTNRAFHAMLRDGVAVEYARADGSIAGDHVRLVDFDHEDRNDRRSWHLRYSVGLLVDRDFLVADLHCRPHGSDGFQP